MDQIKGCTKKFTLDALDNTVTYILNQRMANNIEDLLMDLDLLMNFDLIFL